MLGLSPSMTARDRLVRRAWIAVNNAIKAGSLSHYSKHKCVDCDSQAECYDHRDYHQPLLVEPVCKPCNNRRGPGLPLPTNIDGAHTKLNWLKGTAGYKFSNLDSDGDGYSPTEVLCHVNLPPEESIGNDTRKVNSVSASANERAREFAAHYDGLHHCNWAHRSAYFKEHDPWFVPFF